MEFLPKELWLEIFEYINVSDLFTLTETCKDFYSMIINTRLVDKFTMCLTVDQNAREWNDVKRNYSQLKIKEFNDLEKYEAVFGEIGRNLKKIFLCKLELKISSLRKILNVCPKLEFMVISEVSLEIDEDLESLQLPTFRNLRIYFDGSSPTFFDILENSKAIELCIDNKCSARYTNFDPVKKFIKSQEHLKSLALMYFSINTNLFMDNMLNFVKFRLKKFSMNSVYLGMENVARFQTFMMNHIDTLTTLHVQSPFLDISFFRQFLTLKELQISHTNPFFDSFKNIEILTVENVSGNWMVKFPYVRDLTMIYKYGVFLGMYSDLINLVHLQHLTIIDSKIPELNIPSVCSLSLKNVTICAKRPFRFEDNQIKELNIDSCSSIDWIADFLALESTRLKVLRIRNMNLKELIVTEKEKEKIQTLTFINS